MNTRFSYCLALFLSMAIFGVAGACDDGGTTTVATCDDVCSNVASACGADPSCASACAMLDSATRQCIAEASSCAAVEGCAGGDDAGPGSDGGAAPDGGGTGGDVCLDYASDSAECSATCTTRIILESGLFCSHGCTTADDCGEGFFCVSGDCQPECTSSNTDDDDACVALGWSECASGFDGFTTYYYCDN